MDDLILYGYLFFTALVVITSWCLKRYREAEKVNGSAPIVLSLKEYIFEFIPVERSRTSEFKKVNAFQKVAIFSFAIVIAVTPLYRFISTLGPQPGDYFRCCTCQF